MLPASKQPSSKAIWKTIHLILTECPAEVSELGSANGLHDQTLHEPADGDWEFMPCKAVDSEREKAVVSRW